MSQVIIIEDNVDLNQLLTLNLSAYVGVEVIHRSNAEETIDLLKLLPTIDLIITKTKIGSENTAKDLAEFIAKEQLDLGLIIVGEFPEDVPGIEEAALSIPNIENWEDIIKATSKYLGITPKEIEEKVQPDYVPVPIHYFLPLNSCCCDVFIRIKKGPGNFQYVKRIHASDPFTEDIIQKYLDQGLLEFFIPQDMLYRFTNFMSDHLLEKLELENLKTEEQIEIMAKSYDIALDQIHKLGFTSATIQLTDAIVDNMIKSSKLSPEMSGMLHKIINSENSSLYLHAHMTSIVACECLKNLGHDRDDLYKKLAYASFFKDLVLVDKPELAKINSQEDLESAEISDQEYDLVFNHALESATLIKSHPEAPVDVDTIIKAHHGAINGKGFSTTSGSKLSSLARIFVVSCDFVEQLLFYKEQGGAPKPIIDELRSKYTGPEMEVVIKALAKTLKKSNK
jgi:hypothetical protein